MMCGEGRRGFSSVKVRGLQIGDQRDRKVSGPKETMQMSKEESSDATRGNQRAKHCEYQIQFKKHVH
jgi:hypothetical protein